MKKLFPCSSGLEDLLVKSSVVGGRDKNNLIYWKVV